MLSQSRFIHPDLDTLCLEVFNAVNQRAGVSAELAIRLGKSLGSSPEVRLNMQQAYDLWHVQKRRRRHRIARLVLDQQRAARATIDRELIDAAARLDALATGQKLDLNDARVGMRGALA